MHKSKQGYEGGATVRVDRKCEANVWVRALEEAGERGGEGYGSLRLLGLLVGVGRVPEGVSFQMKWRQVAVIH